MGKEKRGFASASPERRKELSKKGSDKALTSPDRHRFTSDEARMAAAKGLETRRRHQLQAILDKKSTWKRIEVRGKGYYIYQMSGGFILDGVSYQEGAWLVWEDGAEYAQAMHDSQFHLWKLHEGHDENTL